MSETSLEDYAKAHIKPGFTLIETHYGTRHAWSFETLIEAIQSGAFSVDTNVARPLCIAKEGMIILQGDRMWELIWALLHARDDDPDVDAHAILDPLLRALEDKPMTLSAIIKRQREQRGLSMAELARRCGLSKSYIHSIESGATANPSFDTVMRLAWELDANPLTWWQPPDGKRYTGADHDVRTGKIYARTIFEAALAMLED